MSISAEEVKKVSDLARIKLAPSEVTKFQKELSEIILYNARKLAEVKKKTSISLPAGESLGEEDLPRPSLPQDLALANAPETKNGFIAVPKLLGNQ